MALPSRPVIDQRNLQRAVLRYLVDKPAGTEVTMQRLVSNETLARLASDYALVTHPTTYQVVEAAWAVVTRRLAFWVNYAVSSAEWEMHITELGRASLSGADYNAEDPRGYVAQLEADVPNVGRVTLTYVQEALGAFENELYLSSTVMVGVASERAFLDMVGAFLPHLQGSAAKDLEAAMNGTGTLKKIETFRRYISVNEHLVPHRQKDDLEGLIMGIQRAIRIARNDAGHPTGNTPDRHRCHQYLVLASGFIRDMYEMKAAFEEAKPVGA